MAVWALTVVTCAVPSVLPEIQSTGVACEATVTTPMPGTPSYTGLQCQEISDEVPQLVGLKNQVRHGLVRRLKRHLQRHCGHARHVGDLCEGRRIRIAGAVFHSKDSVTRSACIRGDFESESRVAALLCGGGRHSKQEEKDG